VSLTGQERGQHLLPRHPEGVRGDHRELDLGVFEQPLHPVRPRRAGADQVGQPTGQVELVGLGQIGVFWSWIDGIVLLAGRPNDPVGRPLHTWPSTRS
jgi:hypothetical protein